MLRDPVERAHSAHRNTTRGVSRPCKLDDALAPSMRATSANVSAWQPTRPTEAGGPAQLVRPPRPVRRPAGGVLRTARPGQRARAVLRTVSEHPEPEFDRVLNFLGLPALRPNAGFGRWNPSPPAEMSIHARGLLEQHYAPYDDRLEALLGESLAWRHRADSVVIPGGAG